MIKPIEKQTLRDIADWLTTQALIAPEGKGETYPAMLRLAASTIVQFEGMIHQLNGISGMLAEINRLERELAARNV